MKKTLLDYFSKKRKEPCNENESDSQETVIHPWKVKKVYPECRCRFLMILKH
jgi:hypothetical protein